MSGRAPCAVFLLALLLISASALGATRTWTGAGTSDLWSEAANWDSGVPVDGDDLVFPASETQNDLAGLSVRSLKVEGTQGAISGNGIVLNAGLTVGGPWDLAIPIELGGSQTWAVSYGPAFYPEATLADIDLGPHDLTIAVTGSIVSTMDLALDGDVTGTGVLEIRSLGRSRVAVGGQIRSGPVTLEMQGQGQVSLLASNTFDGPLHVRMGTNTGGLRLGADNAIPAGVAVEIQAAGGFIPFTGPFSIDVASFNATGRPRLALNGGMLSSRGLGSPSFGGAITGPGTIRVTGGSQTFTDNEFPGEFSGSFVVENGRLILTRNQSANWGGLFPDAPVSVDDGALGLNGAEVGSIDVRSGVLDLFPQTGAPPTPSRCDALQLDGSSSFRTRLDTPLLAGGSVSLGGAELELVTSGQTVSPGQVIPLIDNAGASPTSGTFAGLPEGAELSAGGVVYRITYAGGTDGKDVTLTVVPSPPQCAYAITPSQATFPSSGGGGSVAVDTEPGCAWTSSSPVAWISTSSQGAGDGTAQFTVLANGGPARSATLTIAGRPFTVEQQAADTPPECGDLELSPSSLPDAHVDRPYAQTIVVDGGVPPYTLDRKSGSLPRGLTFDDGVLSGTPTRTGQSSFTIRATDSTNCEQSRNYTLTVRDVSCPLMIPNQNVFVTYRGEISGCTEANGRLCVKNEPIHFTVTVAEGYSLDCAPHELTWQFGDGTSGSGNPVVHEFASGDTYSVTVIVANEAQHVVLTVPVEVARGRRRAMPHR